MGIKSKRVEFKFDERNFTPVDDMQIEGPVSSLGRLSSVEVEMRGAPTGVIRRVSLPRLRDLEVCQCCGKRHGRRSEADHD